MPGSVGRLGGVPAARKFLRTRSHHSFFQPMVQACHDHMAKALVFQGRDNFGALERSAQPPLGAGGRKRRRQLVEEMPRPSRGKDTPAQQFHPQAEPAASLAGEDWGLGFLLQQRSSCHPQSMCTPSARYTEHFKCQSRTSLSS